VQGRSLVVIGTRGYPSYYGGFETAVRKLAPYMSSAGWDVTVYSRPGSTRPDDPERDLRVKAVYTGGLDKKSISTLSYGRNAARHAAKSQPDVALVMNVANGFFLRRLRRAGIPTLVNVDGMEWEREKWGLLARRVFLSGARQTARWADEIVCDSREIARRWSEEFGRQGHFIPYGGDDVPSLPVVGDLKHGKYALLVARFVPENTVGEFIAAARVIAHRYPVVLVGSSGYGGELDRAAAELAEQHRAVRWLGHVSDDAVLHSLWQHAGAYFHGHSVGGTNPALVQAMAAGAPVVARDTVYNREVLGDAGEYVAPHPAKIADAMLDMLDSPDKQRAAGEHSRLRAQEAYTWGAVCADYERALRSLADRGVRR
jgi:glycosyltransferase involved in cell wall biosynthesis